MKTAIGTLIAVMALAGGAHAETHWEGNCIVTTDPVNHNSAKSCPDDSSNAAAPAGMPQVGMPTAGPSPAGLPPAALPPEWNLPSQANQPTLGGVGGGLPSLVGRWTYTYIESGTIPAEAIIAFDPQGRYQQWRRFPQTPQLGNQIVQVWGSYSVNGNMLTTTPAGMQVMNGLDPHQICNVQTRQCKALDLPPPETTQLTQVDANTVRTPDGGTAHRME